GIADVTVSLVVDKNQDGVIDPAADSLVMTTTTGTDGSYLFDYLTAVSGMAYLVQVDTADPQFPTDAYSNPYVLTTSGNPLLVSGLTSGQDYRDADFGFIAGGSIGDTVWQDNDGDGLQDPDEPGLSGVTVELYEWTDTNGDGMYTAADDATTYIGSTTTDAAGVYQFNSLDAGSYVVKVTGVTLDQTSDPDRLNPCADSSRPLDPACDEATGVELAAGQIFMAADFGYRPARTLGDYVWLDVNGDGVQDADEPGLGGVVIELTQPSSSVITTTTDSDGFYSFGGGDLTADGAYQIAVDTTTLPSASMAATYDLDGTLDDSTSYTFSTGVNGNVDTVDFGYRYDGVYSISGTVFFDSGADGGAYSSGSDTPYANIEVYLWDGYGRRIGTTTTDSSGAFSFGSLPGGGVAYTVSLNPDSPQLGGLTMTAHPAESGACTVCNNYNTVTITAANITGQDFGFYAATDFGDLAASYATLLADEGPYHKTGSLYLGSSVSTEGDGQVSATASADSYDDGVVRSLASLWTPGATVNLTINVTGGPGRVGGWFDWNGDGDFSDAGEFVDFGLRSGSSTAALKVPSSGYSTGDTLNVRFRVFDPAGIPGGGLDAGDFLGQAVNGEVEDYQWLFGVTAVTLQNLSVSNGTGQAIGVLIALFLTIGTLGLRLRRRKTQ
ncbi:MAG: SdrD B-like domain-containing protein, partial [Anaerolineae bacterium]